MQWMQQNGHAVLQIVGGVVSVATLLVKLTPTTKDDTFLSKVVGILSVFSLCNTDGSFIGEKKK